MLWNNCKNEFWWPKKEQGTPVQSDPFIIDMESSLFNHSFFDYSDP